MVLYKDDSVRGDVPKKIRESSLSFSAAAQHSGGMRRRTAYTSLRTHDGGCSGVRYSRPSVAPRRPPSLRATVRLDSELVFAHSYALQGPSTLRSEGQESALVHSYVERRTSRHAVARAQRICLRPAVADGPVTRIVFVRGRILPLAVVV